MGLQCASRINLSRIPFTFIYRKTPSAFLVSLSLAKDGVTSHFMVDVEQVAGNSRFR